MKIKNEKIVFDPATQNNIDQWLTKHYDEETKAAINHMLENDPREAVDAFYTTLSFGTGGLRGIMGIGSNRMNRYTVMSATQGLANYLLKQPKPAKGYSVFIGYDSRHHSREFAEEAAKVLAGNDIQVYLFKELRPAPLVSFGCRFKHCSAGIMITASHNPSEYNGYKVYWNDGAQILPPHDRNIMAEVEKIKDPATIKSVKDVNNTLVTWVGEEIDEAYLTAILPLQLYPEENKKDGWKLKIVYTSLHGAGITITPKALTAVGFATIILVDQQVIPDGNFPTVKAPNPENKSALQMGIDKMLAQDADLLIANDPDADRIGIAVKHNEEAYLINGNQFICIVLHYILETLTKQCKLPAKAAFIKTIVTTELFKAICDSYKKPCFEVLTGFKYIAEKIREWEHSSDGYQFIFGGEESYGCLIGTQTLDKDAVSASMMICEVALQVKKQKQTLIDYLHAIYKKYGYYFEKLLSVNFEESKESKECMQLAMAQLRISPPNSLVDVGIESIEDYQTSINTNLLTGETNQLWLPKSDVLVYWLTDGSKLMIRPSGTEPKIKIYGGVVRKDFKSIADAEKEADQHLTMLLEALEQLLHASTF